MPAKRGSKNKKEHKEKDEEGAPPIKSETPPIKSKAPPIKSEAADAEVIRNTQQNCFLLSKG